MTQRRAIKRWHNEGPLRDDTMKGHEERTQWRAIKRWHKEGPLRDDTMKGH